MVFVCHQHSHRPAGLLEFIDGLETLGAEHQDGLVEEPVGLGELDGRGDVHGVAEKIVKTKQAWMAEWGPKLASDEVPISPYRVISELAKAVGSEARPELERLFGAKVFLDLRVKVEKDWQRLDHALDRLGF